MLLSNYSFDKIKIKKIMLALYNKITYLTHEHMLKFVHIPSIQISAVLKMQ